MTKVIYIRRKQMFGAISGHSLIPCTTPCTVSLNSGTSHSIALSSWHRRRRRTAVPCINLYPFWVLSQQPILGHLCI